jgi:hypothetical protein
MSRSVIVIEMRELHPLVLTAHNVVCSTGVLSLSEVRKVATKISNDVSARARVKLEPQRLGEFAHVNCARRRSPIRPAKPVG